MPQGRRKTPFSGKAKKQQMQIKKQEKTKILLIGNGSKNNDDQNQEISELERGLKKINKQPRDTTGKNRYALQFFEETKEEKQKEEKRQGKSSNHVQ